MISCGTFPATRMRRNRQTVWIRNLVQENRLHVSDLIWPIFVRDENFSPEIDSMPGVLRYTVDELPKVAEEAQRLGIPSLALFPCVDIKYKTVDGAEAWADDSLMVGALGKLNQARDRDKLGIIVDVALDPYTTYGHDGILNKKGYVDNDLTLEALERQAVTLAQAGADIIAPSDMMDGRVMILRNFLDVKGYADVGIMAYSAKFNSAFYAPFRNALGSEKSLKKATKCTYQMSFSNTDEAMREIELDIQEGADAIIIKPGMPYLDIVQRASQSYTIPIFSYQVSGEYSMIKYAAKHTSMDEKALVLESLLAFKRAGCAGIWSYFTPFVAKFLQE